MLAQDNPSSSIDLADGLEFTPENPLTPYALKKDGEVKHHFKVPYQAMVEYFKFAGQGFIVENPNAGPLTDLEMNPLVERSKENLEFYISLKYKKAFPTEVLSPHSVSTLFVLDPKAYNELAGAEDFVTAKKRVYATKGFDSKKLRYDKNMIHLEDWNSLNHPPIEDIGEDLTIWDRDYVSLDYAQVESPYYTEDFQKKIDEISNTELTFGNKLELLENGQSYDRKIEEVKKAKSSVLMAVMSFFCDKSSRHLEDALIERAKGGLDVKLMVEKVWTKLAMKKCLNRMIKGGVDVVLADDLLKKGEEKALFHDKFMVFDTERVIMGGSNIMSSDNISTGTNHMNRDDDVFVEGPVAVDATLSYAQLWREFSGKKNQKNIAKDPRVKDISHYEELALKKKQQQIEEKKRGSNLYAEKLTDTKERSNGVCRFLNQSPYTDKHKLSKVFIEYIQNARERMSMTNGNTFYFDIPEHKEKERARDTWNKRLYRSIFSSVERGIKLDIIGNGIDGGYGEASNTFKRMYLRNRFRINPVPRAVTSFLASFLDKMGAKANQPYLEELAKRENIRAWTHFQYMHSKKMQFDRIVSSISSFNLDEWSADKSHESAIICMDDTLNKQVERGFLKDIINSQPAAITEK